MLKAFHEKDGLPVILREPTSLAQATAIQNNSTGNNGVYDAIGSRLMVVVFQRDLLFIFKMFVTQLLITISAKPGETFHISSEYFITIRGLVEKIIKRGEFNEIACLGPERQGRTSLLLSSENSNQNSIGSLRSLSMMVLTSFLG